MNLILKIFYSPDEALKEIKEKKPIGVPFFILFLISLTVSFLYVKFIMIPNKEALLMTRNIPEEAYERTLEFMESKLFYIVTLLSASIGFLFSTLIPGFIFYLISSIMKGKGEFMAFWSSAIHISAVTILGSIVAFPIAFLKGTPKVTLDFSLLFMFLSEKNLLRIFLENTNFFTLWSLFLYGLALSHIGEVGKKKGIITSYGLWFIYAVIMTVIRVLRG